LYVSKIRIRIQGFGDQTQWKEKCRGGPEEKHLVSGTPFYFMVMKKKQAQRCCDWRGGAQSPVWHVNEPIQTGARSAQAHARPKPTSERNIFI
jgi:hypothetical protein